MREAMKATRATKTQYESNIAKCEAIINAAPVARTALNAKQAERRRAFALENTDGIPYRNRSADEAEIKWLAGEADQVEEAALNADVEARQWREKLAPINRDLKQHQENLTRLIVAERGEYADAKAQEFAAWLKTGEALLLEIWAANAAQDAIGPSIAGYSGVNASAINNLYIPTPDTSAYKGLSIPRNFSQAIRVRALAMLEALRQ